jgi:hypothetical protein
LYFSSLPVYFLPFFDCYVHVSYVHATRVPLTDSASQSLNPGQAGDHYGDKVADEIVKKGVGKAADKASPPSSSRRGGRHWHKHHIEMGWGSRHTTLLRVCALLLLTTIYFIATYFLEFGNIQFASCATSHFQTRFACPRFCLMPLKVLIFFVFMRHYFAKARTFFCQ